MEKLEKQPLQGFGNSSNFPPIFIAFGILAGLAAFGLLKPIMAMCLFVGVYLFVRHQEKEAELKEARSRAAAYANMIGPIVVGSDNPEENVYLVQEKAKAWREKLKLSGNPYADKIPIIEYPYSPMIYSVGQLSAGWSIYCKELAERQHRANIEWYEGKCPSELKALFASAVLPPVKTNEQ
jgi:hypothetical protein